MSEFPHTCDCGSPCYRGAAKIECTNLKCQHGKQDYTADDFVKMQFVHPHQVVEYRMESAPQAEARNIHLGNYPLIPAKDLWAARDRRHTADALAVAIYDEVRAAAKAGTLPHPEDLPLHPDEGGRFCLWNDEAWIPSAWLRKQHRSKVTPSQANDVVQDVFELLTRQRADGGLYPSESRIYEKVTRYLKDTGQIPKTLADK
jgi:hypothetical protein